MNGDPNGEREPANVTVWVSRLPEGRNSSCKGPGAGTDLVCSKKEMDQYIQILVKEIVTGETAKVVDRNHVILGSGCQLPPCIKNTGALLTEILILLVWGEAFLLDFCRCCYSCYFSFLQVILIIGEKSLICEQSYMLLQKFLFYLNNNRKLQRILSREET